MKHIKAIIKPEALESVRAALEAAGCHGGITITEVMGQGIQKGIEQVWRGEKYYMEFLAKVMIDMVIKDEELAAVKKAIMEGAGNGEIGDGKIFVYDVLEAIRIRTGEEGDSAL
jgi:Nitrogen regulatory protein PII